MAKGKRRAPKAAKKPGGGGGRAGAKAAAGSAKAAQAGLNKMRANTAKLYGDIKPATKKQAAIYDSPK